MATARAEALLRKPGQRPRPTVLEIFCIVAIPGGIESRRYPNEPPSPPH